MKETIKDFEKAAIESLSVLRNELGAKRLTLTVMIDDYEKSCKTDVMFLTSNPADAPHDPGCGTACFRD